MTLVREATEADVPAIQEIFEDAYGRDYTYPEFYDETFLKKLIFGDDTLVLVAEDEDTGRVLGTGSVILEIGAYTDLVGEFGRLVVRNDARGRRVGTRIMAERLDRVRHRLHVGLLEARLTHPYSARIARRHGFAPVGFLPMKNRFGDRQESFALMVQYFGDAMKLRRNHPRIVPEAYRLAGLAMENVGLEADVVVDEEAAPYPWNDDFTVQELSTEGYAALLRIERGRVRKREIFGPLRLHYGFFRLQSEESDYLIARRENQIVGAIGFTHDPHEQNVRVFELIALDDEVIRFLLCRLEESYLQHWEVITVEIDVNAHAPRMQRTLLELGFLPVAYIPAMAFHEVERLDVVRMLRLLRPLDVGDLALDAPTEGVASVVLEGFVRREVKPRIAEVMDRVALFAGLTEEQVQRVAGVCDHVSFGQGATIFAAADPSGEMYLVLEGRVDVRVPGRREPVGTVEAGECLGEVALLAAGVHSATARAGTDVEVAAISRAEMDRLVRERPDIGVVLYRNLALDTGQKLRRADEAAATG